MADIYWGESPVKQVTQGGQGELVVRDGESFYKISNYQTMPAFFMSVVSGSDHWMFVSSTGGLTCGRGNPENSLFPYYTDDKIHDAYATTGPQSIFLVERDSRTSLWKPFSRDTNVYTIERHLYKNRIGNTLVFEEVNHDLGLVFSYSWSNSEQFGFVKKSTLRNTGSGELQINILDGLRNVLPAGVTLHLQTNMSTLVDAYKQAEAFPDQSAAIYTMSSTLTDRAEPSEALNATVVWSSGLDQAQILLSEDQVEAFCAGLELSDETQSLGKRGAFFIRSCATLSQDEEKKWFVLAEVNQGPCAVPALLKAIEEGISTQTIEKDIEAGSRRLQQLVGGSDGCQLSSDALSTGRHFANTLFNIMRGGTFYDGYRFPLEDFLKFIGIWHQPLLKKFESLLRPQLTTHTLSSVLSVAENSGDADMERLVLEYLPLIFSRRHGDPSRPWNQFSIDIRNADGSDSLYYQGNWRDIFQNWEALAHSYPEYTESFISKFVNASTADGYNPYRITKNGFEWETLDPDDAWSNIGYWGDHQVNYLLKLIEISSHYHPGRMSHYLDREIFVYADVPYRFKSYESLLSDPRNTVTYDQERADAIAARVAETGSDGKLLRLDNGAIYSVNLLEKLLVSALSKLSNFVPGGGIWMNTQRPDWNDANNALVGYGLSMVTLSYLRRFLVALAALLDDHAIEDSRISDEVLSLFDAIEAVLKKYMFVLDAPIKPADRKRIMDELGRHGEQYRNRVYRGFSGNKSALNKKRLLAFIDLTTTYLDHSIAQNRRPDGLFHSYNLIQFYPDGVVVEHLYEMLEGQVAALSSGYLGAQDCLNLLIALRSSDMYRADQNSYLLYPDRKLPLFQDKNVITPDFVEGNDWIKNELVSERRDFVEQDINGVVHFNGRFKNVEQLRQFLSADGNINVQDRDYLCDVYEKVFSHRQFTGRSGAMYKYEGLGCIYWHMVSKLLLATAEVIRWATEQDADQELLAQLLARYDDIKEGLGLHKAPADYGAFPIDPYSHSTGFSGVQQPGMTGQVKEDVITRFYELGVIINHGEISFSPVLLKRNEFISEPQTWHFSLGREMLSEDLEAGSLGFTLCGVPVIYRLAASSSIKVYSDDAEPEVIEGNQLGTAWSESLFRREHLVQKLVVNLPEDTFRI